MPGELSLPRGNSEGCVSEKPPLPLPDNLQRRMLGFILSRCHGRIEIDFRDGQVIQFRIVETLRPDDQQEQWSAA